MALVQRHCSVEGPVMAARCLPSAPHPLHGAPSKAILPAAVPAQPCGWHPLPIVLSCAQSSLTSTRGTDASLLLFYFLKREQEEDRMCLHSGTTEPLSAACDAEAGWEHWDQLLLQTHACVSALLLPIENHRYEAGWSNMTLLAQPHFPA